MKCTYQETLQGTTGPKIEQYTRMDSQLRHEFYLFINSSFKKYFLSTQAVEKCRNDRVISEMLVAPQKTEKLLRAMSHVLIEVPFHYECNLSMRLGARYDFSWNTGLL